MAKKREGFAYISVSMIGGDKFTLAIESEVVWKEAVERVRGMDEHDGGPVSSMHIDIALRTIMTALECGIRRPETGACADALVMLQQLEHAVRRYAKMTDELRKGSKFADN